MTKPISNEELAAIRKRDEDLPYYGMDAAEFFTTDIRTRLYVAEVDRGALLQHIAALEAEVQRVRTEAYNAGYIDADNGHDQNPDYDPANYG